MGTPNDTDHVIAALADKQHGIVTRAQLLDAGLSAKAIGVRFRARRLRPLYHGVYAVGHRTLTREGRWRAAVLACGEGAVLSHHDAAAHHDLMASRGARIHVTRPSNAGRAPDPRRITLHRVGTLRTWETTVVDGIPVTTVGRTLLDLARRAHATTLEDAVHRAITLQTFDLADVARCLQEHPRQPGAPKLRRLLDALADRDAAHLRSDLERRFLQLCEDRGLPRPVTNAQVAGLEVDVLWPAASVVAELDGYAFHSSRSAFERDRKRDRRLAVVGYTVVRVTFRQLTEEPEEVIATLRHLLG